MATRKKASQASMKKTRGGMGGLKGQAPEIIVTIDPGGSIMVTKSDPLSPMSQILVSKVFEQK